MNFSSHEKLECCEKAGQWSPCSCAIVPRKGEWITGLEDVVRVKNGQVVPWTTKIGTISSMRYGTPCYIGLSYSSIHPQGRTQHATIKGIFTRSDIALILTVLGDEGGFVPANIGLPEHFVMTGERKNHYEAYMLFWMDASNVTLSAMENAIAWESLSPLWAKSIAWRTSGADISPR